jgi:hypothetical protein
MAIEIIDKGGCRAAGLVNTNAGETIQVAGISSILKAGTGDIRLTVDEPVAPSEAVLLATCAPEFILPAQRLAHIEMLDQNTIFIQITDELGAAAEGLVYFILFRIIGAVVPIEAQPI